MTETIRVQVPAGEGRAVTLTEGQYVRIVDAAGGQVGDLFAFAAADPGEYASASHTRPAIRKLFPGAGDVVLTNRRRPILSVLEDTSPGRHDMPYAACDPARYESLGASCPSDMESHDHAMFSGINASFTTDLAGIGTTSAGYGPLSIAPQVPPGLRHVSASIDTVRGQVASSWTKTSHSFTLSVTVPVNATATVSVPLFGASAASARASRGATLLRVHDGVAGYAVGSGHWQFTVSR